MFMIPIRTRIPVQIWALAAVCTIISTISSVLGTPGASVGLDLAQVLQ